MRNFESYFRASLLLLLTACGSSASSAENEECGNNGDFHDGHCDCDQGYETNPNDEFDCIRTPADEPDPPEENYAGRLLVSDGADGRLVVVDLKTGTTMATLSTTGASRVYASSDGRMGFAVQSGANAVQAIDPGIQYVDHGDHVDVKESDPAVISSPVVSCSVPIHFVAHDSHASTFCDGDGVLHVFDDTASNSSFEVNAYDSGRAHHGVGLVGLDHVILSLPNLEDEDDALPIGVRALDFEGQEQFVFSDCPSLHGEASTDNQVCFGCGDGVMCLSENIEGGLVHTKAVSSDEPVEGVRVGTLVAQGEVLVGNWGEDLVSVDPVLGTLETIPFGEPYLQFALSKDSLYLLVLADSGMFHKIRLSDGETVASLALMPEFVRESGHSQLRPKFLVAEDYVYVVDPRESEVFEVKLKDLVLSDRTLVLPDGAYHSLALVSLPPE